MIKQSVVDTTSADASFSCPHGCGAVIYEDEHEKLFKNIFSSIIDNAITPMFEDGYVINWDIKGPILHMDLFDMPCCKKLVAIGHKYVTDEDFVMTINACRSKTDMRYLSYLKAGQKTGHLGQINDVQ